MSSEHHKSDECRLLYIEDYPENVRLLETILSEHTNYRLDVARTPFDALELVRANTYALIISDINLPGMDGYELLSKMRAEVNLSNTATMALTTRNSASDYEKARQAGFDHYATKPYTSQDILKVIDQLLCKHADSP